MKLQYLVKWWGDGSGNTNVKIVDSIQQVRDLINLQSVAKQDVEVYEIGKRLEICRRIEQVPQPDQIRHVLELG